MKKYKILFSDGYNTEYITTGNVLGEVGGEVATFDTYAAACDAAAYVLGEPWEVGTDTWGRYYRSVIVTLEGDDEDDEEEVASWGEWLAGGSG